MNSFEIISIMGGVLLVGLALIATCCYIFPIKKKLTDEEILEKQLENCSPRVKEAFSMDIDELDRYYDSLDDNK